MTEDQFTALEQRVARLEALAGVEIAVAPQEPATIKTLWGEKRYADFPTYSDFAELAILAGRSLTDEEIAAWMAATGNGDPRTHTASGQEIAPSPAVDETRIELGTNFGVHPLIALGVGGSDVKHFGPFAADTRVRVATVEVDGGPAVGLDALDASGKVIATFDGIAKGMAEVMVLCRAGEIYTARVRNLSGVPTRVHIQLYRLA